MLSPARRTLTAPFSRVILGCVLALAIPATTIGAEDPAEDSLCDATTVEAINAIGPLQFAEQGFGSPTSCFLEASTGSVSLTLAVSGISFDLMRGSSPDMVEVMVGDRAAVVLDGYLHVGLDEGILSVILDIGDPDAAGGIDPVEYAIDVAEVALPALEAAGPVDEEPATGSSLGSPPDVAGIEWSGVQDVVSVAQLMEADEQQAAIWQPLLDAAGADATQLFTINVNARDPESGDRIGTYSAIQLVGVDEDRLQPILLDWLRTASGAEDAVTEDISLGGKDVTAFSVGGELQGYLYFSGDTAHALTMPEGVAAQVIEALP